MKILNICVNTDYNIYQFCKINPTEKLTHINTQPKSIFNKLKYMA